MRVFAIILLFVVSGCAHRELLSGEQAVAASQVQKWVPLGTPVADAIRIMEQHGFTCVVVDHGATSFDCDYRRSDGFWSMTAVCAKASFQVTDAKVAAVLVNTHLESP